MHQTLFSPDKPYASPAELITDLDQLDADLDQILNTKDETKMATLFTEDAEPATMKTTAAVPWYGSSRMIGPHVGNAMKGLAWCGVPFAGGMCEMKHIEARSIVACDLHREVINLCNVLKRDETREQLIRSLRLAPFHPDELERAQASCHARRANKHTPDPQNPNVEWAEVYFISQWMGRSGKAGTESEFSGKLSTRFNSHGGDSNTRYRSAVASIEAWAQVMERCNFHCMDAFEFLAKCLKDADFPDAGLYCDPPWIDDGDKYLHKFKPEDHARLAALLLKFKHARVVCRFGDHPVIRQLYPESDWSWQFIDGRTSANNTKAEVLLTRKI